MKKYIKIIATFVMTFLMFSCNEESIIEGRVIEDLEIINLNIEVSATVNSKQISYPIILDKKDYTLYLEHYYTPSSTTGGLFKCTLIIVPSDNSNTLGLAFTNKFSTAFVLKENTVITDEFFDSPYRLLTGGDIINGYYTGNIYTTPINWSKILTTPAYSSPYNGVDFIEGKNTGNMIFTSVDKSIKGWVKFEIYKDKIIISKIGYRTWGSISTE